MTERIGKWHVEGTDSANGTGEDWPGEREQDWPDHATSIHDELDLTAADLYDTEEV